MKVKPDPTNTGIATRFYYIILCAIFIVALMIRLYPVINFPEIEKYGIGPFADSHLYLNIAYNLYKGNGFSRTDDAYVYGLKPKGKDPEYEPVITRGPVYPFFISTIYTFWGDPEKMSSMENWHANWDRVRISQCILDAAICIILFFAVRRIYPAVVWPALMAAGLYSFSFYNIFYTRALLSESVTTFLLTLSLFFCVSGLRDRKTGWWYLTGAGLGLVVLSRPEYFLFLFILAFFIFFASRHSITKAIERLTAFIISAIIVITPWTLRNYWFFDRPIIVSTGGFGLGLYLGTFETNDNWMGWREFPDEIFSNGAEKERVESLFELHNYLMQQGSIKIRGADNDFRELALKRIRDNPWQCLRTWIAGIPRLWYQNYIPMYRDREASGAFFVFYFILAVYAFLRSEREKRILMTPVCLLFLYLTLVLLPVHKEPRYSVALIPSIIGMAGIGIYKMLSQTREIINRLLRPKHIESINRT